MADKGLFSRLKRLFSTDVLIRNVGGNELKVMDVNKIQMTGELETNSLIETERWLPTLIVSPITPSAVSAKIMALAVSDTKVRSLLLFMFPKEIFLSFFNSWEIISGIIYG